MERTGRYNGRMRSPAADVTERRAALAVLLAFAFVSILFTGQVRPFPNPNELSRFEAIYSYVENGTFSIDDAISRLGDHEDKSLSAGHFYSNKAPGLAFAGIPVYRALRVFFPKPRTSFEPIFVLLRMLVVTPVCLLALARFFARLKQRGAPAAALVTASLAFGTNYLFYARSVFQPRLDGGLDPALARSHPAGGRGGVAAAGGVPSLGGRARRGLGGDLRVSARDRRGSAPRALRHPAAAASAAPSGSGSARSFPWGCSSPTTRPASGPRSFSPPPGRRRPDTPSSRGTGCSGSGRRA